MNVKEMQSLLARLTTAECNTLRNVNIAVDAAYGLLEELLTAESCALSDGYRKEIMRVQKLLEGL